MVPGDGVEGPFFCKYTKIQWSLDSVPWVHASPGTKISHSGHRPKPEVRNQCPYAPAHKDRAEKAGEHDDELEISVLLSPLAPHYLYINEKPEEDGTNVYKYPDRIYFISHLIISCSKKHKP